jgi:hypothetical protein
LYGAVSLGLAAVLAYPEDLNRDLPYGNEPGLPIVVKHVLNYELGKELQMSQWNTIPLSQAQRDCTSNTDTFECPVNGRS